MLKRFRHYLPVIIISLITLAIYLQTIIDLIDQWWNDSNYSHGLLIPVISGYFIWQKRDKLQEVVLKKANVGLIILIGGLILNIAGTAAAEFFTVRFSFVVTVIVVIIYFYGWKLFRGI